MIYQLWYNLFKHYISKMPEGFRVTAHTPVCPIAGMENEEKGWYGIQAHPEAPRRQRR